MDTKIIEMVYRHDGFLDANEISVLTKLDYRKVRKDMEEIKNRNIK